MKPKTRREVLAMAAMGALLRRDAGAQQNAPSIVYRDYSRCLPDYLRDLAERAYQSRNRAIAKLTTPAAIRERQQWVTRDVLETGGRHAGAHAAQRATVGSFERRRISRREGGLREPARTFTSPATCTSRPRASRPFPACCSRWATRPTARAARLYQRCCQGLARLGYVVLGFDPMGQGERTYYPGADAIAQPARGRRRAHLPRPPDAAEGHHQHAACRPGTRCAASTIWPRIRWWIPSGWPPPDNPAAAPTPCCWPRWTTGSRRPRFPAATPRTSPARTSIRRARPTTREQDLVGFGPVGFDRWDLLYPLAPKPLLVMVSERDFFGTYSPNYIDQRHRGVSESCSASTRRWATPTGSRGSKRRCPTASAYDMRMQIYNWFGRWLKGETQPVAEEPVIQAEPEETLFVSANGSMVQSFHGETPFTLNRKRFAVEDAGGSERVAACRSLRRRTGRHHGGPRNLSQEPGRSGGVPRRAEGVGAGLAVSAEEQRRRRSRW